MPLIPEISFTEFKKLKAAEVKEMQSVIVVSDGEQLFTAIIPPTNGGMTITDEIKTKAEYLGMQGNSVGGKSPDALRV